MKKKFMLILAAILCLCCVCATGCQKSKEDEVIIYTNADDEAIEAMKNALNSNGYEGRYLLQTFGTSELGGKLLAEGNNLEADLITMSSYYIDEAQAQNSMFRNLSFETNALKVYSPYYTPITSQEGAIIVNTVEMAAEGLDYPESIKELADPKYEGKISVTDISGSSTAWLLIQALISEYGEAEATVILRDIYKNAGAHLEESGSGPLKKARGGEVAIGFGLRHQAVSDKNKGLPIDFIDPTEGNFSLTESVAVLEKGDNTNALAMEMAECIIKHGREELLKNYPNPIYNGETADPDNISAYPKTFPELLTVELLEKHQALSEAAK